MTEACANCLFKLDVLMPGTGEPSGQVFCRRYPPQLILRVGDHPGGASFPLMNPAAQTWCGEYMPARAGAAPLTLPEGLLGPTEEMTH